MNTSKKTAFGILGAAATGALVVGASLPAVADDHDSSSSSSWKHYVTTQQVELLGGTYEGGDIGNESPVVVAPEVGVLNGSSVGNIAGNEVGNGSLNGNHVGSGTTTGIDGVDLDASDVVDSTVGDITGDVSDLLDGTLGIALEGMFED